MTTVNEKRVILEGRIAELVRSRRVYRRECQECCKPIYRGNMYWRVIHTDNKYLRAICTMCFDAYAEKYKPEGVK